jgi:hypothetical protein
MALQPFVGPWPLFQFLDLLHSQQDSSDGGSARRTGQHNHRINAHTDIHASCGIRTHDPSVCAGEDSSCFRPPGHCDRPDSVICAYNYHSPIKWYVTYFIFIFISIFIFLHKENMLIRKYIYIHVIKAIKPLNNHTENTNKTKRLRHVAFNLQVPHDV